MGALIRLWERIRLLIFGSEPESLLLIERGMPEISLYKICLERVYDLVKAGTWKSCTVNPFLNLPNGIIDDLMAPTDYDETKVSEVFQLLTSGSLTRLHLSGIKVQEEKRLFLEVIEKNCCKSLRFLSWYSSERKNIPLIEALVLSCPKLEEFRSKISLNFNVFRNCKELRVLKFYATLQMFCPQDLEVLSSLKNLQVFFSFDSSGDIIATILKCCPQLISLGRSDSLNGLEMIHAQAVSQCDIDDIEIPDRFHLKRCLWGTRTKYMGVGDASYKSSFPEKIRIAVSLCPFVEELIIYVCHTDSFESLKNLKHLTHLEIIFSECDGDYMTSFFEFLKIIGRKLKHLSIDDTHPVPVDIICDFCPQLQSLDLRRFATVSGPVQHNSNILLKRLRIMYIDQNALLYLLSSCKGLVELSLFYALCLDDSLLSKILKQNPLAELKISHITESSLTRRGFRMFLEKAVSLERVNFSSLRRDVDYIVENLIRELNLTNLTYG
ncbi:hypothetical protein HNY73_006873 [Argiope bruennichi]|uniref:Uncharacterized protein n=3 Tax=Argiope bruennichi TaxID=94029 RepID=A0A8T0FHC3_ARGBR|nr:hypothetical protein HNY73_006873 [Argiope bruennichi]